MSSLFEPDGRNWMPTELARGPWDPGALHGGPVAALIAREMERLDAPVPMRLSRLTVELLRPVPLAPLSVVAEVVRPGAKVGMLEASVARADDATVVAVARAQRIRVKDVEFADFVHDDVPEMPESAAEFSDVTPAGAQFTAYHNAAVEHRFQRGMFGVAGPAFDWIRLLVPLVPDESPTGWQRAAAVADFGNGISAVVPFDGSALFINPDLTVNLWREPEGEWVGMESQTRVSGSGIGMSDTAMWDRSGRIGRSSQSLLLDRG